MGLLLAHRLESRLQLLVEVPHVARVEHSVGVVVEHVEPVCGKCGKGRGEARLVPHVAHGLGSASSGRCTVWRCTMCGMAWDQYCRAGKDCLSSSARMKKTKSE